MALSSFDKNACPPVTVPMTTASLSSSGKGSRTACDFGKIIHRSSLSSPKTAAPPGTLYRSLLLERRESALPGRASEYGVTGPQLYEGASAWVFWAAAPGTAPTVAQNRRRTIALALLTKSVISKEILSLQSLRDFFSKSTSLLSLAVRRLPFT